MSLIGGALAHEVGKRILVAYLARTGCVDVVPTPTLREDPQGIDIRYNRAGMARAAKVRVDSYYGSDPVKTADRSLPLYRGETRTYALEETADVATRTPGWVQTSRADELLYYRIAIPRPEPEIAALLAAADGVFFSELGLERDDLRIIPMAGLRDWFRTVHERYTPRPVMRDGRSSWNRIVPFDELDTEVAGVRDVGGVYRLLETR